jgi:sialate O-acetylesterase
MGMKVSVPALASLKAKYDEEKIGWDKKMVEWKKEEAAAKAEGKTPPRPPRAPQAVGKAGEVNSGKMGQLFESYIRPYVGYAIRGVLWDQGESRTNVACVDQYTLMGALIKLIRNSFLRTHGGRGRISIVR